MTDDQIGRVYEEAGFGQRFARGSRAAIVVVDFSYGFTDRAYPTAADMDAEVAATRWLLDAARASGVPIVFTTISYDEGHIRSLAWLRKSTGMRALKVGSRLVEINSRLARRDDEPVVAKCGASGFHGTSLAAILASWRTDTVIVTGATTSGCVRATVVDAVQNGYGVLIPRECVADRAKAPHDANLFDMDQKYGDVITVEDALRYVAGLQG